ncbi:MAG TPA: lysylphosphatidylglycerol synthase domain-containing protein [Candidatus Dormibacteraeota bacterium]|nr:lysylphosphatidylglycerol synthase domain-containing protein [Candidatus Dormibacteraeota bacterium]
MSSNAVDGGPAGSSPGLPARALGALRSLPVQVALAVLLAAGLVLLGSRRVSLPEVSQALAHARPPELLAAALAALGFIAARAWRYRVLLPTRPAATGAPARPAPPLAMGVVTLAAWGPGLLLPTVASDAAFIWLAATRLRAPLELGLGATIVARLLDAGSLLVLALVAARLGGVALAPALGAAGVLAVLAVAVVLLVLVLSGPRRWLLRWLVGLPWLGTRLRVRLRRLDAGMTHLEHPGPLAWLLAGTGLARLFTAFQYLALFTAVGQTLSFWQVWFALSVRTLLLALPLQGVAGLGTTQLWWITALVLLGRPLQQAIVAGTSVHLLDLSVSLVLAGLGWAALPLLPRSEGSPPAVRPDRADERP